MSNGIIKSQTAFEQQLHFAGVEFPAGSNVITPTDIDAVIEFRDRLFVLVEVKRNGVEMETGQRLAYERMCRSIDNQRGKTCVVFKCWHQVPKPSPVMLRDLRVQSFYWGFGQSGYEWRDSTKNGLLVDAVNSLLDLTGISPEDVSRCASPTNQVSMADCPFLKSPGAVVGIAGASMRRGNYAR